MDYITTTELRTKSSELITALKKGTKVKLINRSKVIGEIIPKEAVAPLTDADVARLKAIAEELKLPKLTYEERELRYRKQVMEAYGKDIS